MRPKPQQSKQTVKLPQIANKTMGNITTQKFKDQRPNSSKNVLNQLQRKLFTQLQTYDQKPNKRKSSKIKKQQSNSCRDINLSTGQQKSMEKIAQMMPQLYSKILQTKKLQGPLRETSMLNTTPLLITQINNAKQMSQNFKQKQQLSTEISKKSLTKSRLKPTSKQVSQKKIQISRLKQEPQQKLDSFAYAQNQVNKIYEQYLLDEGLATQGETSIGQLQQINGDLIQCEVDIAELQENYTRLIEQLSDLCRDNDSLE